MTNINQVSTFSQFNNSSFYKQSEAILHQDKNTIKLSKKGLQGSGFLSLLGASVFAYDSFQKAKMNNAIKYPSAIAARKGLSVFCLIFTTLLPFVAFSSKNKKS